MSGVTRDRDEQRIVRAARDLHAQLVVERGKFRAVNRYLLDLALDGVETLDIARGHIENGKPGHLRLHDGADDAEVERGGGLADLAPVKRLDRIGRDAVGGGLLGGRPVANHRAASGITFDDPVVLQEREGLTNRVARQPVSLGHYSFGWKPGGVAVNAVDDLVEERIGELPRLCGDRFLDSAVSIPWWALWGVHNSHISPTNEAGPAFSERSVPGLRHRPRPWRAVLASL